jgi:hypothetical protein
MDSHAEVVTYSWIWISRNVDGVVVKRLPAEMKFQCQWPTRLSDGKAKEAQITCNMPRRGTLDKADVNLRTYFAGGSLYYQYWKSLSVKSRQSIQSLCVAEVFFPTCWPQFEGPPKALARAMCAGFLLCAVAQPPTTRKAKDRCASQPSNVFLEAASVI